jgi:predicted nucleotide-binding protein with TIR-like domain
VKRRIFVGSSTEGLQKAQRICEQLATFDDVVPVLWTDVFQPGLITFEALETMLIQCCAAVFVVTPDDRLDVRGSHVRAPRSNILLEFGLVAGRIGRHSVALCRFGDVELPSDLEGLTIVDLTESGGVPEGTIPGLPAPQDKLKRWTSTLLATTEMIARTDIVHGYTGLWEFNLQLHTWRGVRIAPGDYAYLKGTFDVVITANGQAGRGSARGRLFFRLTNDAAAGGGSYQGEYRTAHAITDVCCNTDGSLRFTTQAFAVEKMTSTGVAPTELSGLDFVEPWQTQWLLSPCSEPRTLEGEVSTDQVVGTHGTAKATKP